MKNTERIVIGTEEIYLKKSKIFGWGVIHPYKIDGKIKWVNLISGGSWIKLGIIAFIVLMILGAIDEYYSNIKLTSACLRALPDYIDLSYYIKDTSLVNNLSNIIN